MNREAAKVWLGRETAAEAEPRLSPEDVAALLDYVAGEGSDSFSLAQLDRAAAKGWSWKTNAAAENHGRESEIYEHCVEREKHYATRSSAGAGGIGAVVKAADTCAVKELL
jgi:hypothetical protein